MKTYNMSTHAKRLCKVLLMSTHSMFSWRNKKTNYLILPLLELKILILSGALLSMSRKKVVLISFRYFCSKIIYCGYSLEMPLRGISSEYRQYIFWCKKKKKIIAEFIASFYCLNWSYDCTSGCINKFCPLTWFIEYRTRFGSGTSGKKFFILESQFLVLDKMLFLQPESLDMFLISSSYIKTCRVLIRHTDGYHTAYVLRNKKNIFVDLAFMSHYEQQKKKSHAYKCI